MVDLVVCFPISHIVLLDLLCGYSVFVMVRSLLHTNSRSRSPVVCVSTSEFADCSCPPVPVLISIFTYLCIPVTDDYGYILLPCSRNCLFECLVEHFSFFFAVRCCWGVNFAGAQPITQSVISFLIKATLF